MDRAAFLAARRTAVCGTDIAKIMGLSEWGTPLSVYMDKRGESPERKETAVLRWGNLLQDAILCAYEEDEGVTLHRPTEMIRSVRYPWLGANLDAVRADNGISVDAKTSRMAGEFGQPGSADVPVDYVLQLHGYMIVTETKTADLAVLVGGSDFRIYHVPFDPELGDMILTATREFWNRVQRGDPPAPRTAADVAAMYRVAKAQAIEATTPVYEAVERLRAIRAGIKQAEADAEELETAIKLHIGNGDTLTYNGATLATWKQRAGSTRLDSKRLRAELPDVYAQFVATSEPTRTFLLKGTK